MIDNIKTDIEVLEPLLLMSASAADIDVAGSNSQLIEASDAAETVLEGGSGDDLLVATGGTNVLQGGTGNDVLASFGGTNFLLGGEGQDTAAYTGSQADYVVEDHGFGIFAVTNASGKDFLTGIESIRFSDGTFAVGELLGGGSTQSQIEKSLASEVREQATEVVIEAESQPLQLVSALPPVFNPSQGGEQNSVSADPPSVESSESETSQESNITTQIAEMLLVNKAVEMQSSGCDDAVVTQDGCVGLKVHVEEFSSEKTERQSIELSESSSETIELKVMEGQGKVFDFNSNASLLTEDVWFLENDTPNANDEFRITGTGDSRNDAMSILSLLENDTDRFGNQLEISAVGGDANNLGNWIPGTNGGAFLVNADGSWNFSAEGQFEGLGPGESTLTEIEYRVDDGLGGTDEARIVIRIDGKGNLAPICVSEQKLVVERAYNDGNGREVVLNLADSVRDSDGSDLNFKLNFEESFRVEGTRGKPGFFGWEVREFNAETGELKLQVFTEQRDNWQYDGFKVSDVFVEGRDAFTPFGFTVTDDSGASIDCSFALQVQDVDFDSPVAIDLNGDGEIGVTGETSSFDKSGIDSIGRTVSFDIDNDGENDTIEWFAGDGDGVLIDNRDGNAANDMDGGRLFGDEGGKYSNGYEKLVGLDADGNGELTGSELDGLEVWVDDGDAVVESGEFRTLQDLGIFKLSTGMSLVTGADGRELMQSTATVNSEATFSVQYSLSGVDASLFQINSQTGEVCFIAAPDYESPLDSDGDNVYELTLERVINGRTISQTVQVAICDKVATTSTGQSAVASGSVFQNGTGLSAASSTVSLVSGTQNGSLTLNIDGTYTYAPNDGFIGVDVFTYETTDSAGGISVAEVCIDVMPQGSCASSDSDANAGPDAVNDTASTGQDVSVTGTVAANDSDLEGDDLTFALNRSALNGVVALADDGSYTYTPNARFVGTDIFSYRVSDGNGGTDIAEVMITVEPTINTIDSTDDSFTTDMDTNVDGNVLENDFDPDGDQLVVTEMTDFRTTAGGTVTLQSDGSFIFNPAPGFFGVDTFSYESSDGNGNVTTATVSITVRVPDAAVDDTFSSEHDEKIVGSVVANDSLNSPGLQVQLIQGPSNGSLTLGADGKFCFVPNDGFSGTDTFRYALANSSSTTEIAEVKLVVADVQYDTSYVGAGGDGLIWGDPHFRGDDGGFYDVQGEADRVYSLLSDRDIQLNARFIHWEDEVQDGTVIGEFGLSLGADQLHVDLQGATLNGVDLATGTTSIANGNVSYDGTIATIDTGEYVLTMTRQDGLFSLRIKVVDPFSDSVAPHGLWGQTVDADSEARDGDFYKDDFDYGLQGGGAIDRINSNGEIERTVRGDSVSYRLYETSELFSTRAVNSEADEFFRFGAGKGRGLRRI